MGRGFLKGVVLGAIVSTLTLAASVALAGSGIGGVFSLGQANTVNKTTTLIGASSRGPQLQVTNTSTTPGASGIAINVPGGKPPLRVNSSALVAKLNASLLQGKTPASFLAAHAAAGGDLSGSYPNPTVATIGGNTPVTSATSAGGDLAGTFPSPSVAAINGTSVPASPSAGQALVATGATSASWQTIANATLPSGQTESGSYTAESYSAGLGGEASAATVFPEPLAAPIASANVLYTTSSSTTHCPGIGQADPGYLCMYSWDRNNTNQHIVYQNGTGSQGAGKRGFLLFIYAPNAGQFHDAGDWAVTAP